MTVIKTHGPLSLVETVTCPSAGVCANALSTRAVSARRSAAREPSTNEAWDGWWGSEPPYHAPVFVLTHHAIEPIEMEGGTTFHFVTEGFDAAYAQALETADGNGVDIAGGASTVRQALNAGVIDELTLDIAPVLLGSGERMFDGVEAFGFEPVEVLDSPLTTHIRYRRRSAA